MVSPSSHPQVKSLADRYRIERELGSGGMATVYLAHDIRHERKVALKVLKPELAAVIGAARFLAEIKTTANLQHPNILPLHDSGEADGLVYYVMPYVEGESLRDRLARETQLPIADAVRIATAVAGALHYAHAHGVIHRDIKPENILLQDGHAVVADFGIALAASSAGSRMTETGMSLGTPHYMSPEQAMGERVLDARTDIYALGCVMYEMLTGEPPFNGVTAQAIVAKVITEAPTPPSKLRSTVPEYLDDAVVTALQKIPADRFNDASAFANAVNDAGSPSHTVRTRRSQLTPQPTSWRAIAAACGVIAAASLIVLGVMLSRGSHATTAPTTYDAALADSAPLSFLGAEGQGGYGLATTNLSVSSQGEFVVYSATHGDSSMLFTRSLRDATTSPIAGSEGGSVAKVSPDGAHVAYLVGNRIIVQPTAGGPARQLMVIGPPANLQWISPRQFVALHSDGNKLAWLDIETGLVKQVDVDRCTFGQLIASRNELVCNVSNVAFAVSLNPSKRTYIRVRNADGTPGAQAEGSDFRVVDDKYITFVSIQGELSAAPYDAKSHTIGHAVSLVTGVRREGAGAAQYDVSTGGTLVFAPGADAGIVRLVTLRPGQAPVPLSIESGRYQRFEMSADRRWLAAEVASPQMQELRVYDLKSGQGFTWLRAPTIRHALWNHDGTKLLVYLRDSVRSAIVYGSPSSATPPETLFTAKLPAMLPEVVDFADDHLALAANGATGAVFRFDPSVRPARMDSLDLNARFITIAPGAKLVAYQSVEARIMLATFPPTPMRRQVAATGVEPIWLSSSELLYRTGVSWYLSRVDPNTGEPVGNVTLWGRDPRFNDTPGWSNRPSNDGGMIYAEGPEQPNARFLRVIPNWVARMKAAVDSANR